MNSLDIIWIVNWGIWRIAWKVGGLNPKMHDPTKKTKWKMSKLPVLDSVVFFWEKPPFFVFIVSVMKSFKKCLERVHIRVAQFLRKIITGTAAPITLSWNVSITVLYLYLLPLHPRLLITMCFCRVLHCLAQLCLLSAWTLWPIRDVQKNHCREETLSKRSLFSTSSLTELYTFETFLTGLEIKLFTW